MKTRIPQICLLMRIIVSTLLFVSVFLGCDILLRLAILMRCKEFSRLIALFNIVALRWIAAVLLDIRIDIDPRLARLAHAPGGLIVLANHHSPVDVAVLVLAFKSAHVRFVARAGLDRGIPYVSPCLRYGGSAILHAKPKETLRRIDALGRHLAREGGVAVIFPEGRKDARNYHDLHAFKCGGTRRLIAAAPGARVVAVAMLGTKKAWAGPGFLPNPGTTVRVRLVTASVPEDILPQENISILEGAIRRQLTQLQGAE